MEKENKSWIQLECSKRTLAVCLRSDNVNEILHQHKNGTYFLNVGNRSKLWIEFENERQTDLWKRGNRTLFD